MDKLLKFLSLDSLRGSRTKLTLIIDGILYLVSIWMPEIISPDLWTKLQPIFVILGSLFGISHFEKKK